MITGDPFQPPNRSPLRRVTRERVEPLPPGERPGVSTGYVQELPAGAVRLGTVTETREALGLPDAAAVFELTAAGELIETRDGPTLILWRVAQ